MATPTNLRVDGLDFQAIKNNFKSFLKSQDKFKDYNFDGSGLNVLLDVLSYNTYYNLFYVNMAANEAFLSTAQRRNSIVAAARSLNYTPRSRTSAKLITNLIATTVNNPSSVSIPRYTTFNAATPDGDVTFVNLEPIFLSETSNYTANNVTLVEGVYVREQYTVNKSDNEQKFIINNTDVDTSTLIVRVQNSSSDSTIRAFTKAENYLNLDSSSLVYFLQEIQDGLFEVKFGNGVFGEEILDGNIIYLDYISSSGKIGNDVSAINYAASIDNVVMIDATVTTPSYGGDDRESDEAIKFNAPKAFSAQNRAVTGEDFTALILNQPNIDSVAVWGGEDNDPPYYGKVFIAAKPKFGNILTTTEKTFLIENVIKPKKIITMSVDIVDPEYINLILDATIKYDSTKNILTRLSLESLIRDTIQNYNSTDLNQFSRYFRYSKLTRLIDTAERSILSTILKIRMRRNVSVQLNTSSTYVINFSNYIDDNTLNRPSSHPYNVGNKISSNEFTYAGLSGCFLEENNGIMRIYRKVGTDFVGLVSNIGTVDYEKGKIVLNSFTPNSFADGSNVLKLTAYPKEYDILPLRTQIVTILPSDVNITLIDDNKISLTKR